MRYIILGTAGHIDHGKSSLVKALTGIDPDRLKEEKERGITIDLGFADLSYPDGLRIGIVDVPGHEKLVRNMLAGAGGIDMVLLVIAADEGVMPQTKEHLYICDLLKIKSGLIALTKADLVDKEWLELVMGEVRDFVKGTFLEGADIVAVSSKTGMNLEILREKIRQVALKTEPKPSAGLFRLPIDRVFTLRGFGTVVTGTAISGSISVEDTVEILPRGLRCKVRGLQSHGRPIEKAFAGQRVAINLQGVEKEDLSRGDTLCSPDRFKPTTALDAKLELLKDTSPIKNRALFHFHTGTFETIARAVLYNAEELKPGQSAFCQLRLEQPVVVQSGDRYILRRFSPVDTIGGGVVLDPSPEKRKKKEGIDDLRVYESGSIEQKISMKIKKSFIRGTTQAILEGWLKAEIPLINESLKTLKGKGEVIEAGGVLLHKDAIDFLKNKTLKILEEFHAKNPLKPGMPKEELRALLRLDARVFPSLIAMMPEVVTEKETVRLKSFISAPSSDVIENVLLMLKKGGFQPPMKAEIAASLKMNEKHIADILNHMHRKGSTVRINDTIYVAKEVFDEMMRLLNEFFSKKPEMTVAEFRDLLGTTRKYAVPFLEYLDSNGITIRVGDVRKFLPKGK